MALGGIEEFVSKAVVMIDGDDRGYLKAVDRMRRADSKANKEREDAIVKQLAAQGKLTQENFRTALAMEKQTKFSQQIGKTFDEVGKKIGNIGKSLGGFMAGLGIGAVTGAIDSVLQKVMAPPTDEALAAMVRYGEQSVFFAEEIQAAAQKELETRRLIAAATKGQKDALDRMEAVDHRDKLTALIMEMSELDTLMKEQPHRADAIRVAMKGAREEYERTANAVALIKATVNSLSEPDAARSEQLLKGGSDGDRMKEAKRKEAAARAKAEAQRIEAEEKKATEVMFSDWWSSQRDGSAIFYEGSDQQKEAQKAAKERARLEDQYGDAFRRKVGENDSGFRDSQKPWQEAEAERNQLLADSFGVVASGIDTMTQALVKGELTMGKAMRAALGALMGGIREYALGKVKTNIAEGIEKWPLGMHHFAAAAAWSVAAGVMGAGASRLGGGGGGGGGGGASYGGAPSSAPPQQNPQQTNYAPIVVGEHFSELSPRQRAARAQEMLKLARRGEDDPIYG